MVGTVKKEGKPKVSTGTVLSKACPKCGKRGKVGELFGERYMNGYIKPQSWCNPCRSKKTAKPDAPKPTSIKAVMDRKKARTEAEVEPKPIPVKVKVRTITAVITAEKEQVEHVYRQHFPRDAQKRSWRTMVERIKVKLGAGVELSDEAKTKFAGV